MKSFNLTNLVSLFVFTASIASIFLMAQGEPGALDALDQAGVVDQVAAASPSVEAHVEVVDIVFHDEARS
jgi:hypothetical protein